MKEIIYEDKNIKLILTRGKLRRLSINNRVFYALANLFDPSPILVNHKDKQGRGYTIQVYRDGNRLGIMCYVSGWNERTPIKSCRTNRNRSGDRIDETLVHRLKKRLAEKGIEVRKEKEDTGADKYLVGDLGRLCLSGLSFYYFCRMEKAEPDTLKKELETAGKIVSSSWGYLHSKT